MTTLNYSLAPEPLMATLKNWNIYVTTGKKKHCLGTFYITERIMAARFRLKKGTLLFSPSCTYNHCNRWCYQQLLRAAKRCDQFRQKELRHTCCGGLTSTQNLEINLSLSSWDPMALRIDIQGETDCWIFGLQPDCCSLLVSPTIFWQGFTWISRARKDKKCFWSVILISAEARNHLPDCRSYSTCFDIDHRLFICNLKGKLRRHVTVHGLRPKRQQIEALKSEQTSEAFRQLVWSLVIRGNSLEAVAHVLHDRNISWDLLHKPLKRNSRFCLNQLSF